ncbi:MAG: helix-turn-helix domain-containing protein, partial [Ruminococcus sp.]|nr:helix-turn-helix domain-containing protein [Ruminococcus sp.]
MEDYKIKIGKRIETALALSGKKQKDLAEYLGILPNTISYFCKGTRTPNTEQIIKIAQFLDVSADYLLGLSDNMTIDADIQTACKVTGLSQNTIYTLQAMKECNYFEILNKILSCEQLEDILNKIYMYCQEELKIKSFANALSELSNVKVSLSDDSTSSVHFRNVLI